MYRKQLFLHHLVAHDPINIDAKPAGKKDTMHAFSQPQRIDMVTLVNKAIHPYLVYEDHTSRDPRRWVGWLVV